MKEFVIDLFCGAGGTSEGVHLANCDSTVTACVNHDEKAIESHRRNHPKAKHFIEDIRNPEVVWFLKLRVDALRKLYPDCIITIWASLECTNFSKAKGGLPREADSRTLANHLFMYLDALKPDYLMIENVVEFMAWGPLDENGKPVSRKRGQDYLRWIDKVKMRGYRFDWKELNSADYGAYTARNRYFAQFAKDDLPISWPVPTHTKNPSLEKTLFDSPLKKWNAVKEVLDFSIEGNSIFNRKKPLVDNTLKRIYAGLVKFVANGDDSFIKKYFSGRPAGKVISTNGPAGTITTVDHQSLVSCDFIVQRNTGNPKSKLVDVNGPARTITSTGGNQDVVSLEWILKYNSSNSKGHHNPPSIDEPCPTVAVQNRLGLAQASFLQSYYGNGNAHNINEPCPTITTKDRFSKINYLMLNYSNGDNIRSVDSPAGTVVINDKHNLVDVTHFLFNPQFKNEGNSIEKPCPVIIARQDKKPLGLIICEHSENYAIPIYKDDSPTMVKIKQFMAVYGITDIKMRMLVVEELLQIQGFPKDYELVGTQTDKKKFIGNSVEVTTAKKLFEAHHEGIVEYFERKNAA